MTEIKLWKVVQKVKNMTFNCNPHVPNLWLWFIIGTFAGSSQCSNAMQCTKFFIRCSYCEAQARVRQGKARMAKGERP